MTTPLLIEIGLWGSVAALCYAYAGYLAAVWLFARIARQPTDERRNLTEAPFVSVVVVARNAELVIAARLRNLLDSRYPAERLEIVVVSDGSTDRTEEEIRNVADPRIRSIIAPNRLGKAHGLNLAVQSARGEIIVFADVRQSFEEKTIIRLVEQFADTHVGAVSGSLEIRKAETVVGGGLDLYWRLEKLLRLSESRLGGTIGCTGAVYAIRKSLHEAIPSDTILDDVLIPMRIQLRGYKILFEPLAKAWDPQPLEPALENRRKTRTLAGNYQLLFRYPGWLLPWRNKRFWQLISHKYLRLAGPWLLLAALALNACLVERRFYFYCFIAQLALWSFGLAGLFFQKARAKIFAIPAGFIFLNAMSLAALFTYLRSRHNPGWQPLPPAPAAVEGQI
jgi:cellulose synthase/poly-beta-1,6-N-acetylglucosamine synthase-like glycosyltransferase